MTRPSVAVAVLCAGVCAGGASGAGCGKGKPLADAGGEASATTGSTPSAAASDAAAIDASRDLPKPMSQEQAVEAAQKDVAAATEQAKDRKVDCDKIVDLLDVSFALAASKMGGDDKPAFTTFAGCAKKKERWRLLEVIANAMIDGDPTLKATYYLPRALVGIGQYDTAARMASGLLKGWPKEGEVYTTAALASSRLEEWETTSKQADQALLIQRQKGAQRRDHRPGPRLQGGGLAPPGQDRRLEPRARRRQADQELRVCEQDARAERRREDERAHRGARSRRRDLLGPVPSVRQERRTPWGPIAAFRLYNVSDKPLQVRVEVTLPPMSEPIGKAVTVIKGRRELLKLSPPIRSDFKIESVKATQGAQLGYKITSVADGTVLYEETRKVNLEPRDRLPTFLHVRGTDYRPVRELAAGWITPGAKAVAGLLEAAKKRVPGGDFAGNQGPTLPQVVALWDELRSRGVTFVRDPSVDSEAARMQKVRLPAEVIGAQSGNALEGSLVFATLLEAIGLDVIVVNFPGNVIVGWVPTKADHGTPDAMKSAVPSPFGNAYFLETTMIGEGPADAAVLHGDAEFVERVSTGAFSNGSASAFSLAKIRKAGIVPDPSN